MSHDGEFKSAVDREEWSVEEMFIMINTSQIIKQQSMFIPTQVIEMSTDPPRRLNSASKRNASTWILTPYLPTLRERVDH